MVLVLLEKRTLRLSDVDLIGIHRKGSMKEAGMILVLPAKRTSRLSDGGLIGILRKGRVPLPSCPNVKEI